MQVFLGSSSRPYAYWTWFNAKLSCVDLLNHCRGKSRGIHTKNIVVLNQARMLHWYPSVQLYFIVLSLHYCCMTWFCVSTVSEGVLWTFLSQKIWLLIMLEECLRWKKKWGWLSRIIVTFLKIKDGRQKWKLLLLHYNSIYEHLNCEFNN